MTVAVDRAAGSPAQRVAERYGHDWAAGDYPAMYRLLAPGSRRAVGYVAFASDYRTAEEIAGVTAITVGPASVSGSVTQLPMRIRTAIFGTLRLTEKLPVEHVGTAEFVRWSPALRFPGLIDRQRLFIRLSPVARGRILAADGGQLSPNAAGDSPLGAAGATIAGGLASASIAERAHGETSVGVSGLERLYNARLAGRAPAQLVVAGRVIARSTARAGTTIHTTIEPALEELAVSLLGAREGGIAVIQPSTGAVLALAGVALSAAQPPGSTFKIITATAALDAGMVTPQTTFPVQTGVVIDGYLLHNADGEACGGTLTEAFAVSCNSVFAPLGARLGAARLVAEARAFGFDDPTRRLLDEAQSSIPSADQIGNSLAVGSSAIGQGRVLATTLQMATVAATIADHGIRARPGLLAALPLSLHRVTSSQTAGEVRGMMLAVAREGTATAVQIPGVPIAAKTGTAELHNSNGLADNPQNDDAWLVAFPAVANPPVAVGVMLVGAGAGGSSAAPIARAVLQRVLAMSSP
jgi:cell division protein FtsI/penicillin-binding protein 2